MKPAVFTTMGDREAYEHGRTQGRLTIARDALKQILEIANSRGRKRSMLAISARAKLALERSDPAASIPNPLDRFPLEAPDAR